MMVNKIDRPNTTPFGPFGPTEPPEPLLDPPQDS